MTLNVYLMERGGEEKIKNTLSLIQFDLYYKGFQEIELMSILPGILLLGTFWNETSVLSKAFDLL